MLVRLTNCIFKGTKYTIITLIVLSGVLSIWLHNQNPVIMVNTTLSPSQYIRLVRRGVTAPQLLYKPLNYSITEAAKFCKDLSINQNYKQHYWVFMMIVSSWENSERRDYIRRTWATYDWFKDLNITNSYKFIISQPMEGQKNSQKPTDLNSPDILIADLNEHYYLLDIKVSWGFSEILQTEMFDYILKADDDTFVNLYRLPSKISAHHYSASQMFYGGHALQTHKWSGQAIDYAAGSGYVMSRSALCAVVFGHAAYSLNTPRIPIEDAYTGLLHMKMGNRLTSLRGFATDHESCKDFTTVIFHHIHMKLFRKLMFAAVNGTHFC